MADLDYGEFKALKYLYKQRGEYLEFHKTHSQYVTPLRQKGYVVGEYVEYNKKPKIYTTNSRTSGGKITYNFSKLNERGKARFKEERRRRITQLATLVIISLTLVASILVLLLK